MFTVVELQTNNGTTSVLTYVFTEENKANQKYHEVLSYASVSEVDIHSASILNEYGNILKNEFYDHTLNREE